MSSNFLKDRGPAKYFHGRKEIIDTFSSTLEFFREEKEGTIFLIQGAPGAGKTALLDVLSNQAKPKGWAVAKIGVTDLYTPASMAQSLGKSYTIDTEYALKGGIKFIEGGLVESMAGHASPREILKHLAPETGLILVLDEAQRVHKISGDAEIQIVAEDTLDMIHNGRLGKPVMLLAGGLGTTESALNGLGISRINSDCTVNLGQLDKESESVVIRDWLTHTGGAKDDPSTWIESIAQQAHGWPQHIISYINPAVKHLKSNHGHMTDEGLELVIEKGTQYREKYYQKRMTGVDKRKRQVLAKVFDDVPLGETMDLEDIISVIKEEYSDEEAIKLFMKALERGIIDEREDGDYGIPIPSMHTWLVDEYAKGKSQGIQNTPKELSAKPEQLLPPKKEDPPGMKKDKGDHRGQFSQER